MPVSTNFDPLAERMRRLRVPQDFVARLSGLPPMAISKAVNHQVDLDYPTWRRVQTVIADLEEIVRRAGVPVDWRNHQSVKEKLAELEAERTSPPAAPTPEDWRLLGAVTRGDDPVAIAAELQIPISALVEKLKAADKRFQYSVHQLRQQTRDAHDLIAANRAAFDEHHRK